MLMYVSHAYIEYICDALINELLLALCGVLYDRYLTTPRTHGITAVTVTSAMVHVRPIYGHTPLTVRFSHSCQTDCDHMANDAPEIAQAGSFPRGGY